MTAVHFLTPGIVVAEAWFRYWFAGFHPDGDDAPWPRRVTAAGEPVRWVDAHGTARTGTAAGEFSCYGPELNPFQTVVRDDGLFDLVPASRVFGIGDPGAAPCGTCVGQPPAGFSCRTCGATA